MSKKAPQKKRRPPRTSEFGLPLPPIKTDKILAILAKIEMGSTAPIRHIRTIASMWYSFALECQEIGYALEQLAKEKQHAKNNVAIAFSDEQSD